MVEPSYERERGQEAHLERGEYHREPDADEYYPDVLDRRIGEQPFEVVLQEGVDHAHYRGEETEDKHDPAPPPVRYLKEVERDPQQSVDGDLEHGPAHKGGDIARRGGMRLGEPRVQGEDAGLCGKAEKGQQKSYACPAVRYLG